MIQSLPIIDPMTYTARSSPYYRTTHCTLAAGGLARTYTEKRAALAAVGWPTRGAERALWATPPPHHGVAPPHITGINTSPVDKHRRYKRASSELVAQLCVSPPTLSRRGCSLNPNAAGVSHGSQGGGRPALHCIAARLAPPPLNPASFRCISGTTTVYLLFVCWPPGPVHAAKLRRR